MRGIHVAQHLLRVVDLCPRKPLRTRHHIAPQGGTVGRG